METPTSVCSYGGREMSATKNSFSGKFCVSRKVDLWQTGVKCMAMFKKSKPFHGITQFSDIKKNLRQIEQASVEHGHPTNKSTSSLAKNILTHGPLLRKNKINDSEFIFSLSYAQNTQRGKLK